jgi:hypothetical protein
VVASGAVGTITHGGAVVEITGVSASGDVGSVTANRTVALTGVAATGAVGTVIPVYWILVDDSETSNWQNVNNAQTAGWSLVDDTETSNWNLVETA